MSAGLVLNGRFRLIQELGRGAMGTVWRAEDLKLEAPAAVKLIDAQFVQSPEALARFKREAKAAAAIRSTHVVQILEYGVDGDVPYIAMELLKGETLAARLERDGRLSPAMTLTVLTHVARALRVAHDNGIVHRDLKPDNVFLVREMDEDVGKVLDFGIARKLGALGESGGFQTQSGAVLGTPYYMSPEHTMGQFVDHRSDIWSFGVIAFECLVGKLPFQHDSLGGLFRAICVAPPPVPSTLGPVPAGFDAWFARATSRDPNDRFQSINDAIGELKTVCLDPGALSASRAEPPPAVGGRTGQIPSFDRTAPPVPSPSSASTAPHRRRTWLVVGGVVVVASVAFVALRSFRSAAPDLSSRVSSPGSVVPDSGAPIVDNRSGNLPSPPIALKTDSSAPAPSAALSVTAPVVAPSANPAKVGHARAPVAAARNQVKHTTPGTKKPVNVAGF